MIRSRRFFGGVAGLVLVASALGVGAVSASGTGETLVGAAGSSYEPGALDIEGAVPGTATGGPVTVFNNVGGREGKVGFVTDGRLLARTNGAGNDGVASHAFAFRFQGFNGAASWQNTVPFALGSRNGRDTLWTPQFRNVGIQPVHMGEFSTDNGAGDQDPTVGIIRQGNFRAVDGDFGAAVNCNRPGKVCFQRLNGTAWQQIGRTNGPGDDGQLISFTVVTVRTGYTLDSMGKIVNTEQAVPVAQINGISHGQLLGLQTPNFGNTIGTQTMLSLPKLP
jgi:hypothetical protein